MLTSYLGSYDRVTASASSEWVLAIDTSAERAGVALWNGTALHEMVWPSDRRQTTEAMSRIDDLLASADVDVREIVGVVVAQGPGTFTGLRVGMSIAKGLAIALGIPIAGVPTLDAIALPWAQANRSVVAMLAAGRGRLVWQSISPGGPSAIPVNGTPAELLASLAGARPDAMVGELPVALREALSGAAVPVLSEPGLTSRIGAIALLGAHRLRHGHADDLVTLEPLYVHGLSKTSRPVRDARP
ncbi:MAG TPA: tRNA (adenosine(37)-N6)-threonylcarbamoyltransferase complex dimerization subunit type 1 TsaB [Thermomicrobiales bacterium]|nr:tRNA (adenosine(37)-N6)-threonylcarbamoyltransferase complex dimerization subunit type 1 TsaB [Thermomicrobiales bacterium]